MAKVYTFKDLQDEVLGWLDEADTSGTTLVNVKAALQQAHLQRLTQQDWNFMLWPTAQTFATVSGTRHYSLHSDFYKPLYFFDQTGKKYLIELSGRGLAASGARWNTDTGSPTKFTLWGRMPVQNQPASAGVITIVSSSGSDTTPKTVKVRGTDSTGSYVVEETFTMNGLTPVVGTTTFSNPILSITLSAAMVGTLTLTCGSTTLLTLQPGEFGRSYPRFELLNDPTTATTVEYRFYRQPRPLVDDNDIPDIPPPFTQLLVWDALISMAAYNTDINGDHISLWARNQQQLVDALIAFDDSGNSLEAEPRYVRNLDLEDDGYPRVFSS